ncbi:hypoxanthine phosphoribosyltransferase [Hymenobacter sp. BT188]|uniref:phosphoribosyltransferase n=1 Tax=Hymenobacter sp. BT188 TaxID=2763504 RepID=UPI00165192B4|nr:phosphoribosyltransferase family protein [Hymenobacter sp. BT188]MBC6607177.1 hypoxanthine phosphoribosyltransferase [Hymenobacter sp. BT188]
MPQSVISLHNKQFAPYLTSEQLADAVRELAARLNADYATKTPLFVAVLNGSFMFASDLLKELSIDCEISFVKMASYEGTSSTGAVKELLGLREDVQGRHLVVLEDIVDTGHTIRALLDTLGGKNPASLEVACLLIKPDCLQHKLDIRYPALSIPNDFVVGYGLDYDGLGRNYPDLYKAL